jgi:histidinol phosphatase-like enzyme (inositol monophosphatase family)
MKDEVATHASVPAELTERLELALAIAREAGNITLRWFRRDGLAVDRKADDSPVTVADRESEAYLRRRINEEFPHDAILGEELGEQPGSSGMRWILDPIDGTKSFIHGVPLYGTLIGLECEGQCMLGVIRLPALNECVYAVRGGGAWVTVGEEPPRPALVSTRASLADGLFLTSEVKSFDQIHRRDAFDRLQDICRLGRTWGDCFAYAMVATGRAEVAIDPLMNVWDAAALAPILEEAGGTYTDWEGERTIYSGNGLATNGRVLEEVLAVTRRI